MLVHMDQAFVCLQGVLPNKDSSANSQMACLPDSMRVW